MRILLAFLTYQHSVNTIDVFSKKNKKEELGSKVKTASLI